ncbi:MAG TPA: hypothetical protein VFR97_05115 [Capillimicrobium sp.]|nr:hypothetical protein [Capillimicrobium sp.]
MSTADDDRIPEANSPEARGDEWDADATDVTGELDDVGETLRDDADRPEGGEIPLNDEDRLDDRS